MQAEARVLPLDQPENSRLRLFRHMLLAREADAREDILFRQGRGQFHVASTGHESLAALVSLMLPQDWIFTHYRDKALVLARGLSLDEIALGFFAKAASASGGRQLVSHYCDKDLNIPPAATPTGLQCLPAAGVAWGIARKKSGGIVFCNIGDASTRQGEFFEALAFARQEKLPVIYVVEDNGFGISTSTEHISPLALGMMNAAFTHVVDGRSAENLLSASRPVIQKVRNGEGPAVLWVKLDRLTAHTGSDDHTKYRPASDIEAMWKNDPLSILKNELLADGYGTELDDMTENTKDLVKETYRKAASSDAPRPENPMAGSSARIDPPANENGFGNTLARIYEEKKYHALPARPAGNEWTMVEAVNSALDSILSGIPHAMMFGEDIEDAKGGVFGLTKGLSTRYPDRVLNSPLAEATIAGLASGLSMSGILPVFELQFIDFVGPAFNQIVNQIATLDWRSNGQYRCPMIIYAPCGSYISNGGPWHSQTNEAWFAHTPGLKVYMPGNANDAANLMYNAAHGSDPVLVLLPKNQFRRVVPHDASLQLYPERARVRRRGSDVTLVAWGNCAELAETAAHTLALEDIEAEVIELCSLAPCDYHQIFQSAEYTGRLIVIQEDSRTCSFGQNIIARACSNRAVWHSLYAPPQLISRPDVNIGFATNLEKAALPCVQDIVTTARQLMGKLNG